MKPISESHSSSQNSKYYSKTHKFSFHSTRQHMVSSSSIYFLVSLLRPRIMNSLNTVKTDFNSTCTTQETKTFPPPRRKISCSMAERLFKNGKQSNFSNFINNFRLYMMSLILKCFINEGLK
jgi:hypothetical protein